MKTQVYVDPFALPNIELTHEIDEERGIHRLNMVRPVDGYGREGSWAPLDRPCLVGEYYAVPDQLADNILPRVVKTIFPKRG